jgi:hypothetical protein
MHNIAAGRDISTIRDTRNRTVSHQQHNVRPAKVLTGELSVEAGIYPPGFEAELRRGCGCGARQLLPLIRSTRNEDDDGLSV